MLIAGVRCGSATLQTVLPFQFTYQFISCNNALQTVTVGFAYVSSYYFSKSEEDLEPSNDDEGTVSNSIMKLF